MGLLDNVPSTKSTYEWRYYSMLLSTFILVMSHVGSIADMQHRAKGLCVSFTPPQYCF